MKQYVGKRVIVTTKNTRYEFDVFTENDIHGEAFSLNGGVPRYLNGRHSDVEIRGTKLDYLPWMHLKDSQKRVGEIVEGGFLYFRYFSHFDYITTTRIEKVGVVDLPNH